MTKVVLRGETQHVFSKFLKLKIALSVIPMVFNVSLRNLRGRKFEEEVDALKKILGRDDVCFDIGGASGRYAYPISKIVTTGKIFSFEPGQYSFFILSAIKVLFNMKNVTIYKKALGEEVKNSFLISPIKASGKVGYSLSYISDVVVSNAVCEPIEIATIDQFCDDAQIDRLHFIKCDTEGAEMMIFRGGFKTIKQHRPIILAEIDEGHLKKFCFSVNQVRIFFEELSYHIFRFKDGKFFQVEDIQEDSNYFFVPHEKKGLVFNARK